MSDRKPSPHPRPRPPAQPVVYCPICMFPHKPTDAWCLNCGTALR